VKPSFLLEIITPEGGIVEKNIESLVVPREDGFFGILANHAPMTSTVDRGIIKLSREGKDEYIVVDDGILEVRQNRVIILSNIVLKASNLADAFDALDSLPSGIK